MIRRPDEPAAVNVADFLVILAVGDLARARRFYDAAFGWEVLVEVPPFVEYRVRPGLGVGIYVREGFAANTGVMPAAAPQDAVTATELYLRVADPEAVARRLEAAGARLLSPMAERPWGDRAAYFADPDGNVVAVAGPTGTP